MPTVDVKLTDLPRVWRDHLEKDKGALVELSMRVVQDAMEFAQHEVDRRDLVFSGNYTESFMALPRVDGAFLVNVSAYAQVIELGRRPGARMPPYEPILEWVEGKLGLYFQEAEEAAFAIRRAIAKRGIPPQRIMAKTASWSRNLWKSRVRNYLRKRGGTGTGA